ncbi:hypothetical protein [Bifidobacterium boum]|uniref:hypothetical protein n=1 Tax=Bifidobacterium boum TaxID=78343 RepID=UPI00399146FD
MAFPITAGAAHCNSIQVVQLGDLLGEPSTPALDVVNGPCRLLLESTSGIDALTFSSIAKPAVLLLVGSLYRFFSSKSVLLFIR